jgi:hypothetical protein
MEKKEEMNPVDYNKESVNKDSTKCSSTAQKRVGTTLGPWKMITPVYRCSACEQNFEGCTYGQVIRGHYRYGTAKPFANLCENCFFILATWIREITASSNRDNNNNGHS